jgi:hypothetical protein
MENLCRKAGLINDSRKAGKKQIQKFLGRKRQSGTEKYMHLPIKPIFQIPKTQFSSILRIRWTGLRPHPSGAGPRKPTFHYSMGVPNARL